MKKWIVNLLFKWRLRRLVNNILAVMNDKTVTVRELRQVAEEMKRVGEHWNSPMWIEEGQRLHDNAEQIVMNNQ